MVRKQTKPRKPRTTPPLPKPKKSGGKLCEKENCDIYCSYNVKGQKTPRFCKKHKSPEMVDVIHKLCEGLNCTIRPNYNVKGQKTPKFCKKHASTDMVDVTKRTCELCDTIPIFNLKGEKKGRFCVEHKTPEMVDVVSYHCQAKDCPKHACYNKEGIKKPIFCATHAPPGMVNVVSNFCEDPECDTIAIFNLKGEKKGRFCKAHASDDMVDLSQKLCTHPDCEEYAYYNLKGEKVPIFCSEHKSTEMTNVVSTRCLECDKFPSYNFIGLKKGLYCNDHARPGMINVKSKRCKAPMCDTFVSNKKYEGYCLCCCLHLCPNIQVSKNYKTKEKCVADLVKTEFPNFDWVLDKRVADGCSTRRPDILLDLGEYVLVVEVDENQHERYDCSCENKRLMEISRDVGHRPLLFLRFNPDEYLKRDNTKVTTCWRTNRQGVMAVAKTKKKEWKQRMDILFETIHYWIDHKPTKTVDVIHLFYDEV